MEAVCFSEALITSYESTLSDYPEDQYESSPPWKPHILCIVTPLADRGPECEMVDIEKMWHV
jgi:hypothetical protein